MKIAEIIESILRGRQWAIYDRQTPLQKLNMSGEAPLFKVNEVELKYLIEEMTLLKDSKVTINNLTKIENTVRSLNAFRLKYQTKVINLLKKGYQLG